MQPLPVLLVPIIGGALLLALGLALGALAAWWERRLGDWLREDAPLLLTFSGALLAFIAPSGVWIALGGASIGVVLLVAVLLGLRHATDPDHIAAVTTLVASRQHASRAAARLGAFWGLGHALTLVLFGLPILLFALARPAAAERPSASWRTIETEHFRVHFPAPFEPWAARAAEARSSVPPAPPAVPKARRAN